MALADALLVIAHEWPEVSEHLTPDEVSEARRQLAAVVHGATWDPGALVEGLLAHEPETHPAWEALAATTERRMTSHAVPVVVAATALRLVIEAAAAPPLLREDPDAVDRDAEERILLVPMLPIIHDAPTDPEILVVPHHGSRVAPQFQFDAQGALLQAVARVNRALNAADDPWGVASWWLSPHASLHAIPADVVRAGAAEDVVAAAAATDVLP